MNTHCSLREYRDAPRDRLPTGRSYGESCSEIDEIDEIDEIAPKRGDATFELNKSREKS